MVPVQMRIFEKGRGDCLTCCIASILELPYCEVPTWMADSMDGGRPHSWHEELHRWMEDHGYLYLQVGLSHLTWSNLPGVLCVASMPSQRFPEGLHAVVGTWDLLEDRSVQFRVVWDPSPTNRPYGPTEEPIRVSFLVRRDPASRPNLDRDTDRDTVSRI